MTEITKSVFGTTPDGRTVSAFTFHDGENKATVIDLGGTLQSIVVPDKNGNPTDVLLGYDDVKGFMENSGYLGALIGRFGNRIDKGRLTIDGKEYQLYLNDRGNHLHGGKEGFNKKIWDAEIDGEKLVLKYFSADGEENYPGNLQVTVVYTFQNGVLGIDYTAVSDKKTAINLTNHAYFNMSGAGNGDILTQPLQIDAPWYVPTDDTLIPHGELKEVDGTPFDFRKPNILKTGDDHREEDPDLKKGKSYDHCFVFANDRDTKKPYASLYSPETGIKMLCYTDMPAVQLYVGQGLNQDGKGGKHYGRCGGLCLETQAIPNNVNVERYAQFGSSIYEAGKVYHFTAAYAFSAKK